MEPARLVEPRPPNFGGKTIIVDENLSPMVVVELERAGFRAVRVEPIGIGLPDPLIALRAARDGAIILTANTTDLNRIAGNLAGEGFAQRGARLIGVDSSLASSANRWKLIVRLINLAERFEMDPSVLEPDSPVVLRE
jgi:hypothetical protein